MSKAPSSLGSHLKDDYVADFCIREGVHKTRPDLRRALQSSPVYALLLPESRPLSLKERRQRVINALPGPIWDEFAAALRLAQECQSIIILSLEEEVQILESILTTHDFVDLYAKRPTDISLLNNPSSASMTTLRNLLNEVEALSTLPAPDDDDGDGDGDGDEEEDEVTEEEEEQNGLWWATYDQGEEAWMWSDMFRQAISAAAKGVQKEVGDVGLCVARWAVRDKYAQTVGGIAYGRGYTKQCEWYDASMDWLIDECLLKGRRPKLGMVFAD